MTDDNPQRGSPSAQKRNETAKLRDEAASLRDDVAELRDEVANVRDTEARLPPAKTRPSDAAAPDPGDSHVRDQAGEAREHDADDDDLAARDRDQAAEERDQAARTAERSSSATADGTSSRADAEVARRDAASDRRDAEQDRVRAAEERTAAGMDRNAAAGDRRHSERDRDGSATDRTEATEEIDAASLDALTGTYSRGAGMAELERDHSRASRSGDPMTLAFVDVDDLKGVNDRDGHPAGDRLLRHVGDVLRAHMRPHDVTIRYGGDEFICAFIGLTLITAAARFAAVDQALAEASEAGTITVGLAELQAGESLPSLIQRADDALYDQRRRR